MYEGVEDVQGFKVKKELEEETENRQVHDSDGAIRNGGF